MSAEQKQSASRNGHGDDLPLVIVNPKSASGSTRTNWAGIAADLRAHFGPFSVAFTKKQGDGIELARRAVANGRRLILACGGDGTVNEVINGILASDREVEFGIVPSGTGGDFRRTIGMSAEPREAARELRTGKTRVVDVGQVTFIDHQNQTVTRFFLNVSSFGLSAAINERVKRQSLLSWLPANVIRGKANFALSTLQEIFDTNFVTVRVRIDGGEEKTLNTIIFAVANSRFFGGGMKIAPRAKLNDGYLDVINIGDIRTMRILLNAYRLYDGSHLDLAEVRSTRAKRIEVAPVDESGPIFLETDGELPGRLPAVYEIRPQALKVRVPAGIN